MASSVFYKFKSQKTESRVTFDGTGISVFDLKREIILANNLAKANDFDLYVYDAASNQEYRDDSHIIPRSSSIVVKRMPAAKQGKGKAAMYVAGAGNTVPTSEPVQRGGGGHMTWHKGAMSKRFDGREEQPASTTPKPSTPSIVKSAITQDDEAAAMAAMFQAQTANWEETQEKMSHATKIYTNSRGTGFPRGGKPFQPQHHQPNDRPLPPSYVCYRCGQKGHWIQDCPTNNDRDYDNRPRIKRTTGIPRSMLKAVENPSDKLGQGVMVTPEGGYVVAQPDLASWQKQVSRPKGLTAAEVRERPPNDSSLACPIDNKLFRDAVKTPCCSTNYCEECIQTHLLERDFMCPNCGKKIASLDKLAADKSMRSKVGEYIEHAIEESRRIEGDEDVSAQANQEGPILDQDLYSEQQPGGDMDMSQVITASIPQLQAQISQISLMLQNPNLPPAVRQQTEMQHQQLQMELQHAQTFQAALAVATSLQQQQVSTNAGFNMANGGMGGNIGGTGGFQGQGYQNWSGGNGGGAQFAGQQAGQDSAYQRLPVNSRRRNLKRDRPSDFLEVASEDNKVPRYWE